MTKPPEHLRLTKRVTPGLFCVIILPFIATFVLAVTTNGRGAWFAMGAIICAVMVVALGVAERTSTENRKE